MHDHATPEHGLKRLEILLAHFIDHAASHANEIRAQREAVPSDGKLGELLERALTDVETARSSLSAVLRELGAVAPCGHGEHD